MVLLVDGDGRFLAGGFGQVPYGYDPQGHITLEERSVEIASSVLLSATQMVTRSYNAWGQLTASGPNEYAASFTYSPAGNVRSGERGGALRPRCFVTLSCDFRHCTMCSPGIAPFDSQSFGISA